MGIALIVILVLIAVLVVYGVSVYNKLVFYSNQLKNAFAQIEVQLKRRYDLIPNLVETSKAYMTHEKTTLESVIQARNQALQGLEAASASPGSMEAIQGLNQAEGLLQSAMSKFSLVVEDYPELKANETIADLQEELTSTENKVGFARQAFNDSVMAYNVYKQSFPQIVIANVLNYKDGELLEFADSEAIQEAPKVSF